MTDEIRKVQEELDEYGPQESPKELPSLQSQLKDMDKNLAGLQEKRDHFQQKLERLKQIDEAGANTASDQKEKFAKAK